MADHCVKIYIPLSDKLSGTAEERERIYQLEDEISDVVDSEHLGEFDGNEFGEGVCTLYLYGRNADALFSGIEPVLKKSALCADATIYKRYGDADDTSAKEIRAKLNDK